MTLVPWEPFRDIDRVFGSVFEPRTRVGRFAPLRWIPATDLVETDGHWVLRADLPGLSEDDVKIEVKDGVLTYSGERKSEYDEDKDGVHRIERVFGSFSRTLKLPRGTHPESVTAKFDNGVLEVRIPKPVEAQPHRVKIADGSES